MKLIIDNLKKYEDEMNLSTADIAELSELPYATIAEMEQGLFAIKDIAQLCSKLGLDYSSICDDGGFKQIGIIDQYLSYPTELKQMVTKSFYKKIIMILENHRSTKLIPFHYTVSGRYKNGSAAFTEANLTELRQSISECIDENTFNDILARTMYAKISNYNYVVAKDVFDLSYNTIGEALGCAPSTAAGWGGKISIHIPDDILNKLLHIFGDIDKAKFTTHPMTAKEMSQYTTTLQASSKDNKFPDPPTDAPKFTGKSKKSKDTTKPKRSVKSEAKVTTPKCSIDPKVWVASANSATKVQLNSEQALKLYSALTDVQKQEVNDLISRLFFD